jgi:hypothetical protein
MEKHGFRFVSVDGQPKGFQPGQYVVGGGGSA